MVHQTVFYSHLHAIKEKQSLGDSSHTTEILWQNKNRPTQGPVTLGGLGAGSHLAVGSAAGDSTFRSQGNTTLLSSFLQDREFLSPVCRLQDNHTHPDTAAGCVLYPAPKHGLDRGEQPPTLLFSCSQ